MDTDRWCPSVRGWTEKQQDRLEDRGLKSGDGEQAHRRDLIRFLFFVFNFIRMWSLEAVFFF